MRGLKYPVLMLVVFSSFFVLGKEPKALVEKMVQTVGGLEKLHAKRDVSYTYLFQRPNGTKDVSIEQYIFDGELSRAEYTEAGASFPDAGGKVIQGFDGNTSWVTVGGQLSEDAQLQKVSDFLRKTNYYWFAMMFKLTDPGIEYAFDGTRTVEGIEYEIVRITFAENVGDVQDIYVLYINPYTHLVDQFLFTVMDFGMADPLLMKITYETVDGLVLPTIRRFSRSDWEGNPGDEWTLEIMSDIRFNTGLNRDLFRKPGS